MLSQLSEGGILFHEVSGVSGTQKHNSETVLVLQSGSGRPLPLWPRPPGLGVRLEVGERGQNGGEGRTLLRNPLCAAAKENDVIEHQQSSRLTS